MKAIYQNAIKEQKRHIASYQRQFQDVTIFAQEQEVFVDNEYASKRAKRAKRAAQLRQEIGANLNNAVLKLKEYERMESAS